MASALRTDHLVRVEDYLAGERLAERRHEYLAGMIYAMAGTTVTHTRIVSNLSASLHGQLRHGPCEVFSTDIKVRIRREAAEFYYYPDLLVDCSRPAGDAHYSEAPRVIFEVLSKETERIDREEKRLNYQSLPSLAAYVLIDQFDVAVSVYRRTPEGWTFELLTELTATLELPAIGCRLPLTDAYERTGLRG